VQRGRGAKAILVRALCSNEACKARASMTLRKVTIKAPTKSLQKGVGQTLRLALSTRARSAIRKAIGSRRSMKAQITVRARDMTGNEATVKRTITLKR
jgi:hypothetical protein